MFTPRAPMRVAAISIGVFALSLLSCGREVTAPQNGVSFVRRGMFSVDPQFPRLMNNASLSGAVQFEKVRVVLRRADGSIALDTTVLFPAGADSVSLAMNVPLGASTGASGENLKLSLGYVNAAGDTVFKGGPVDVTVLPAGSGGTPPPIVIPVVYSGTGSTATAVQIAPRAFGGYPGDRFGFTASAVDATGRAIVGTPVFWSTNDGSRVNLDSNLGGVGAFAGARGTAKLYAQLLTGQLDSVTLTVLSRPSRLALVSGDNQTSSPSRTLADPLVVRVVAADGQPAAGVVVSFSASAGTVAPTSATSDNAGLASTRWTLGTTAGHAMLTATSAALTGSSASVTFNSQTVLPRATRLAFDNAPASVSAGAMLTAIRVVAQDSTGAVVPTAVGTVTLALGGGAETARLGGTASAPLVNGIATFADLTVNRTGTGYTLAASASSFSSASSAAFNVTEGAANNLRFASEPGNGVAGRRLGAMRVQAFDLQGNPATAFSGAVSLRMNVNPGGAELGGTLTRTADRGVATFDDVTINRNGVGYTLAATSAGLATGGTIPFDITSGAAGRLTVVRGAGQSAPASSVLDTIIVQVTDSLGNAIVGAGVGATAAAGNGTVTMLSAVTDAAGQARLRWTLGAVAGGQQITIGGSSLSATVTATAVGSSGPTKVFLGFDNLNVTTGVPTALSVFLTAAQASPVTVSLSTLDALSQWTTGSIVIPAGATSASATILGLTAGASRAVASAPGAGADTVNLTVTQATVRLFNSYLSINGFRDTVETRVELSAPARAGGVTVSFDVSTPGLVVLAPSPGTRSTGGSGGCDLMASDEAAVAAPERTASVLSGTTVTIKAGETQAYLYVIGDSLSGSTSITPIAAGYGSSSASAYVQSRILYFSSGSSTVTTVGAVATQSVSRSSYGQTSQAVTFTARTLGVLQVPAAAIIRAEQSYQTVRFIGLSLGSTWVVASAAGYSSDSLFVEVRKGALDACCDLTVNVGTATQMNSISVYAYDTTHSYASYRATPLTIAVTSSNPSVAVPGSATITVGTDLYYAYTEFTAVAPGTAWLYFNAPGYQGDSVRITVAGVAIPSYWGGQSTVGAGQYVTNYLYLSSTPFARATSFTMTSSNPAVAVVDSTLLLAAGSQYTENYRLVGVSPGTATITSSAPGVVTNTQNVTVTAANFGHTSVCCLVAGGSPQYFNVVARDANFNAHPVVSTVNLTITSTDTMVAKSYYATNAISQGSTSTYVYVQPRGAGTAWLRISAPGYDTDSLLVTVASSGTPTISISSSFYSLGRRQRLGFGVNRAGSTAAAHVSISKRGTATAISDTGFNVGAGSTYAGSLTVSGLNLGTDTLIFTAPSYTSDTVIVKVTTPKLVMYGTSGAVLANYPYGYVQFYLADSLGNSHEAMDTVRFSVTSSDTSVARMSPPSMEIMPGNYYAYNSVQYRGPGRARFRIQDLSGVYAVDSAPLVTVEQPVLRFNFNYYPLYIGMRQRTESGEAYVYTDYPVLVPTWIKLQRSTAALVTMPDSVLMPADGNYAYFDVAGRDTVGGLQVQASSPGFASALGNITVSRPAFQVYTGSVYTSQRNRAVEVVAIETGDYNRRDVTENVSVALSSDAVGVVGVDSATVTIPAGSSDTYAARLVVNGAGRANITASDPRGSFQHYLAGSYQTYSYQAALYPANERLRVGVGQRRYFNRSFEFYADENVALTTTGTGGHTNRTGTAVDTMFAGNYYLYSSVDGISAGADTLVTSSPGYTNGRVIIEVSEGTVSVSSQPLSMKVGDVLGVTLYLRSPENSYVEASVSTTLTLTATNAQWWDGAAPLASTVIASGNSSAYPQLKATTAGTATFTISAPGYLSKSFTVQVAP